MHNIVYISIFALFSVGMFGVITVKNKIKRLVFLGIMQTAIIMLFVATGYKQGQSVEPFINPKIKYYVNPVPQVLMLTAIVVGLATSAVGLAIAIQTNRNEKI